MCLLFLQLYGRIYRVVEPKRVQLNAATVQLSEKQAALAEAQSKLQEVLGTCLDDRSDFFTTAGLKTSLM